MGSAMRSRGVALALVRHTLRALGSARRAAREVKLGGGGGELGGAGGHVAHVHADLTHERACHSESVASGTPPARPSKKSPVCVTPLQPGPAAAHATCAP